MAAACTASASVSVTVEPATATAPLSASATSRSVAPRVAFTVNALAAGTDVSSRPPSKVSVSAVPFTDADWYAGGVTLSMPPHRPMAAAKFPDRSWIRFAASPGTMYANRIDWSCLSAKDGLPTCMVTVLPETEGAPKGRLDPPLCSNQ